MELHNQGHDTLSVFDVTLHRLGTWRRRIIVEVGNFVELDVEILSVRRAPRGDLGAVILLDRERDGGHFRELVESCRVG